MVEQPRVTREEAHRIATEYIEYLSAWPISEVVSADEATIHPYSLPAPRERLWVAYVAGPDIGLVSSTIVLVSKDTGEVVYYGSANDEG